MSLSSSSPPASGITPELSNKKILFEGILAVFVSLIAYGFFAFFFYPSANVHKTANEFTILLPKNCKNESAIYYY